MKTENVAVRKSGNKFVAYYIGDDAPLIDVVGDTRDEAIRSLYREWKRFHSILNQSQECGLRVYP